MTFHLSDRSDQRLAPAHQDIQRVIRRAIGLSTVDFTVLEVLRTPERQDKLVASGASQTYRSRHLTGHAADLGAWVDGAVRWDWPLYYRIAEAVQRAATAENVAIEWGGCWGAIMQEYGDPETACQDYVARRQEAGLRAFIDGPHFQLPWDRYPVEG
jgi:peptidoglycan L-alanyl-D-glutamate endopeptidase CwlK